MGEKQSQFSKTGKSNIGNQIKAYRNHNTLTEDHLRYEHPKDVIKKCTTKKYGSNLQYPNSIMTK